MTKKLLFALLTALLLVCMIGTVAMATGASDPSGNDAEIYFCVGCEGRHPISELEKVDAKPAENCQVTGQIAHWKNTSKTGACGDACYQDAQGKYHLASLDDGVYGEHDYQEVDGSDTATCCVGGEKTIKCTLCSDEYTEKTEPTYQHPNKLTQVKKDPAECTKAGTKAYYVCDYGPGIMYKELAGITVLTKADVTIEATGHSEELVAVEPYSIGVTEFHKEKCPDCNEIVNEKVYCTAGDVVTENATCSEDGSKKTYCTECGQEMTSTTIPATGEHVYGAWTIAKDGDKLLKPTCLTDGKQIRTCACGATQTKTIAALGHWFEEITYTASTCTGEGIKADKCTRCGLIVAKEAVDPNGHTAGEWTTTKEATCTEKGQQVQKCTVCDVVIGTKDIDALGHKAGEWTETKAATCTDKGEKVQKCTVCSAVVATEEIAALGHTWGEWVVTTPATYEAEGVETKTCTVCKATETRAIAKLEPTVAPTTEPTDEPTVEPTTEPTAEPTKAPAEDDTDDTTTDGDVEIPKTGDNSSRTAAYVLLTIAIAGMAVLFATKRNAIEK